MPNLKINKRGFVIDKNVIKKCPDCRIWGAIQDNEGKCFCCGEKLEYKCPDCKTQKNIITITKNIINVRI